MHRNRVRRRNRHYHNHHNGRMSRPPQDDPWRELLGHLVQLERYVSLYLRVRQDAFKVTVRETLWRVLLVILARIAVVVVIAMSIVYLFDGVSHGLALVLGGRQWLASLLTGGGALVVLVLAAWAGHNLASRAAHRQRVAEYEEHEDRYKRAAARAGIPEPTDGRGPLGDVPRPDGHRPQRSESR